jgi:acyl-CoA thioesterase
MSELALARRCAEKMYADDKASQAMGITVSIPQAGAAIAVMTVREDMLNGFSICHGGIVCVLADTAFAFACNAYDQVTVAAGAQVDFVRPGTLGDELTAVAAEDYRGKKTGFYTIRITNQREELIAVFRGRSASRAETLL